MLATLTRADLKAFSHRLKDELAKSFGVKLKLSAAQECTAHLMLHKDWNTALACASPDLSESTTLKDPDLDQALKTLYSLIGLSFEKSRSRGPLSDILIDFVSQTPAFQKPPTDAHVEQVIEHHRGAGAELNDGYYGVLTGPAHHSALLREALAHLRGMDSAKVIEALCAGMKLPKFFELVSAVVVSKNITVPTPLADVCTLQRTVCGALAENTPFRDYVSWELAIRFLYQDPENPVGATLKIAPALGWTRDDHMVIAPESASNRDLALLIEAATSLNKSDYPHSERIINTTEHRRGTLYLRLKALLRETLSGGFVAENLRMIDLSVSTLTSSMAKVYPEQNHAWHADVSSGLSFFGGLRRTGLDVSQDLPNAPFSVTISQEMREVIERRVDEIRTTHIMTANICR